MLRDGHLLGIRGESDHLHRFGLQFCRGGLRGDLRVQPVERDQLGYLHDRAHRLHLELRRRRQMQRRFAILRRFHTIVLHADGVQLGCKQLLGLAVVHRVQREPMQQHDRMHTLVIKRLQRVSVGLHNVRDISFMHERGGLCMDGSGMQRHLYRDQFMRQLREFCRVHGRGRLHLE